MTYFCDGNSLIYFPNPPAAMISYNVVVGRYAVEGAGPLLSLLGRFHGRRAAGRGLLRQRGRGNAPLSL